MTNTTSVEKLLLSNPGFPEHPRLLDMIALYSGALADGYDPEPGLLSEMFVALGAASVNDTLVADAISSLQIAMVEEIFLRDSQLTENPALPEMLQFYAAALAAGYTMPEALTSAIIDVLQSLQVDDPSVAALIDEILAAISPVTSPGEQAFGVLFLGEQPGDGAGLSVSTAGDVNGDGIDDLLIGAYAADPNDVADAGKAYVVLGSEAGFDSVFDLGSLDGTNGFALSGFDSGGLAGIAVSSAGDVNGDGYDDVLVSAMLAAPNGRAYSGQTYVVFGSDAALAPDIDLASLNGDNGFRIDGLNAFDLSGSSVSSAGDINGDSIDDLLIGAPGADPNGLFDAGEVYVVFGTDGGFGASFDLETLDGSNGFAISGLESGGQLGSELGGVASAGDVNGDGIDDVMVGASFADANGADSGKVYVVFGGSIGLGGSFDLSVLNGTNGFVVNGLAAFDNTGSHLAALGDVNGDGIDDIAVNAPGADPNGADDAGRTYVLFGSAAAFGASVDVSALDGDNGFVINGIDAGDLSGKSISSAGDVDGDGFDDILIGAPDAANNGAYLAGEAYLVFGRPDGFGGGVDLDSVAGSDGFIFRGIHDWGLAGASVSSAGDLNGDGYDDILIGSDHSDSAGEVYLVFGGMDNLQALDAADGLADGSIDLALLGSAPPNEELM